MSEVSLGQICEFINHYLDLLEKEVVLLEASTEQSRKQEGSYQDGFLDAVSAMKDLVEIESELQLAWRQLEEVIDSLGFNPMIEEYCQKTIFEARSISPLQSLQGALQTAQKRKSLQTELQKYLLRVQPHVMDKRFPTYIEKSFESRWEKSLRRLRSSF